MSVTTPSGWADNGKWTVEGDRYCLAWIKDRNGAKLCYDVFAEDGLYKLVDEKGGIEFTNFDKKEVRSFNSMFAGHRRTPVGF